MSDGRNSASSVNGGFSPESGIPWCLDEELLVMAREGRLKGLRRTRHELVQEWLEQELDAETICRRLSCLNREVILAVVQAHAEEYPWLSECTFLEFGSGGREEQVLGSDQDNGLLLETFPDEVELEDCTQSIVLALDGAGISLCTGGVMVSNPEWRGDYDTWLKRLTGWLSNPAEKGPWQSGLILDFKAVFGSTEAARRLRAHLWQYVQTKPIALSLLVDELTDYRMPLTFYGTFITEKDGVWQGYLNIKNSVLAHLTNAARILALKYDLQCANTCERLRRLTKAGHISVKQGEDLLVGWEYLQRKRLLIGLDCDSEGAPPHNYVHPGRLNPEERRQLKNVIHSVERFVRLVQAGAGL